MQRNGKCSKENDRENVNEVAFASYTFFVYLHDNSLREIFFLNLFRCVSLYNIVSDLTRPIPSDTEKKREFRFFFSVSLIL